MSKAQPVSTESKTDIGRKVSVWTPGYSRNKLEPYQDRQCSCNSCHCQQGETKILFFRFHKLKVQYYYSLELVVTLYTCDTPQCSHVCVTSSVRWTWVFSAPQAFGEGMQMNISLHSSTGFFYFYISWCIQHSLNCILDLDHVNVVLYVSFFNFHMLTFCLYSTHIFSMKMIQLQWSDSAFNNF